MKFARGLYIIWVFFRYGLDELLLSSVPHRGLRMVSRVLTGSFPNLALSNCSCVVHCHDVGIFHSSTRSG